ncbi:MAG: sialate O-acetylesterase, partial [Planctomycetota bacterium]
MKKVLRPALGIALMLLGLSQAGWTAVKPARPFADHMVLQQGKAGIWGTAAPREKIHIDFRGREVSTAADIKGRWQVTVPTGTPGGPFELTLTGTNTVKLTDILVGEVWLGGGQSNMNMTLRDGRGGVTHWQAEVKAAHHPQIRLLLVPNGRDRHNPELAWRWTSCTPAVAKDFSATLTFFARRLQAELNVPVGIVNASQGGSAIQPWLAGKPLYQKCIAPLLPQTLRGVLWYQGEANVGMSSTAYGQAMKALIQGWRRAFGQALPFYYVQTAPVLSKGAAKHPLIWEGMTAALDLP